MKIEDQVCTLKQARRLYKLGIELNTIWSWMGDEDGHYIGQLNQEVYEIYHQYLPAPTVAELGILLPKASRSFEWDNDNFPTEAQARCAALIWLLENKHLKPKELKL